MSIYVENLCKRFEYYKKEEGLKGSFKNIFRRKKLIKHAVDGISFSVPQGEILALLGPNGAGKTTTLKMLSGILYPTSGTAQVAGFTPWERKTAFKKQFAIVMGQKNQLWPDLPARETFRLNQYMYEIPDKDFKKNLAELTELLSAEQVLDVQVRRLSLGERMKMELIASLLHRPSVLFLDEPTIGLDIIAQKKIREFIRSYNEQTKTTIILTSHSMQDIEALSRRAIIINNGKAVYDGSLENIRNALGQKKILKIKTAQEVPLERIAAYGTVRKNEDGCIILEAPKQSLKRISAELLEAFDLEDFTVEDLPLEESIEVFFTTGRRDETAGYSAV